MAKIQLKSDNINPFGGLFSIFKQFDRSGLRRTIDSTLGHRGTTKAAFSYGDVFASLFGSYLCGGDCVDLDFDHQFIAADKKDAKYSYKKADGYFPGVASVGGFIVGVENRDGNANVKFRQSDTLERLFNRLEKQGSVLVRNFRADCGSFSEDILRTVAAHCEHFYIRASNCHSRYTEFMEHADWTECRIGGQQCGATSFRFDSMLPEMSLRLVVQRTRITDENPDAEPEPLFGTDYVYRCIVTNDWDSHERDIIVYYNRRGASERNFDCQNNDFGWGHLPFSFLKENTVFLIATAILKNFYLYLLGILEGRVKGLDRSARLKRFMRCFVIVLAKWIKSGRIQFISINRIIINGKAIFFYYIACSYDSMYSRSIGSDWQALIIKRIPFLF